MDHQELTAKLRTAQEPTDRSMDQLELHALELSQPQSHTTTPTPPPVDHMLPQVTSLTLTHLHQSQPKPFFNLARSQPKLMPFHHQRKCQSSTQRLQRPTLLSTDK